MPRIPTYQQQTTAQAALNVGSLDTGGQEVVRGMAVLAGGVHRVAENLKYQQEAAARKAEQDDVTTTTLDLAKGEVQWDEYLAEKKRTTTGDATGFAGDVETDFNKWAAEVRGKPKTERGKAMAELGILRMQGQLQQNARQFEAERGVEIRGNQYRESTDFRQKSVRRDPSSYERHLEEAAAALDSASLGEHRDREWLATKERLSSSAVEGMIARDPYGTLKRLQAEPGKSGFRAIDDLTADDSERAIAGAQSEIRRREAEARARAAEARQSLSDQEADAFAAKAAGLPAQLPSRAAYVAAYGAEGNARYQQKTQLIGIYDVVSAAVLLPPAEGVAAIAKYRPTQQAGAADQAQAAQAATSLYLQQRKAFEADPAGMIVGRDAQARSLLQAAMAPDAKPAAWQAYATRVRSVQQSAGIKDARILPVDVADQVASRLTFDPAKPENRTKALQVMQAQFGSAFPAILREVSPKLDSTARVLVGMTAEAGSRLDAALAAGGKETLGKVVSKQDQKTLNDRLSVELQPLANTLRDNVDFEAIYGQHFDAAQVMAMSLVARGETPAKAAQTAAAAVINDQFDYRGTVRVPKGQATDAILTGAEAAKREAINKLPLRIAASSYSNDAAAQQELKAAIGKDGYWVTDVEQSGLTLMVRTQRGSTQVLKADGTPVSYTWQQLAALGVDEAAQQARAQQVDLTRRAGFGGAR